MTMAMTTDPLRRIEKLDAKILLITGWILKSSNISIEAKIPVDAHSTEIRQLRAVIISK
jgi:hypothetical protein